MTKIWTSHSDQVSFDVHQMPLLEEHFTYILATDQIAVVIDPTTAKPITKQIKELGVSLEAILITHYFDDLGGIHSLKKATGCTVIGPKSKDIEELDQDVLEGDENAVGPFVFQTIALPGHTVEHVGYYFPECSLLFCGDALFFIGAEDPLEGSLEDCFASLQKIKKFPPKTILFCSHNDTEGVADSKRSFQTLEESLETNPFLKVSTIEELKALVQQHDIQFSQ